MFYQVLELVNTNGFNYCIRWGSVRTQDVGGGPFVSSGLVWFAGTGTVSLATSDHSKVLITNLISSSKTLIITQLTFFASQPVFVNGFITPTTGLPTTTKLINNAIFDGRVYDGPTTLKADVSTTALSGGIAVGATLGVGAGLATQITGPLILPPGNIFGMDAQATGNTTFAASLSWIELPV